MINAGAQFVKITLNARQAVLEDGLALLIGHTWLIHHDKRLVQFFLFSLELILEFKPIVKDHLALNLYQFVHKGIHTFMLGSEGHHIRPRHEERTFKLACLLERHATLCFIISTVLYADVS